MIHSLYERLKPEAHLRGEGLFAKAIILLIAVYGALTVFFLVKSQNFIERLQIIHRISRFKMLREKPLTLGKTVSFTKAAPKQTRSILMAGWSYPEYWGVWNQDWTAKLAFHLENEPRHDLTLTLDFTLFLAEAHPTQSLSLSLNGRRIHNRVFTRDSAASPWTVTLPRGLLQDFNILRLTMPDARSPLSLGLSNESRPLAIGLKSLRLDERGS